VQRKKIVKLVILQTAFLFCGVFGIAQNANLCRKSTEGTEFWFGFMESRNYNPNHFVEITVTARETTTFEIRTGKQETQFNGTYTVFADSSIQVEIPWQLVETIGSEEIQDKGIYLTAQKPVNVYALNWDQNSADVAVIYPVESLGYEYFAMCYKPDIDLANPMTGNGRNSEFLIVATQDNTTIEITPSKITDKLRPKDSTFIVTLDKGQVYQVQSENEVGSGNFGQGDLTGSHVVANKPVAFYSGSLSTKIPFGQCCWDHLYEQIPPVQTWGREYFAVPLKTRQQDRYRILAAENNTVVQITGLAPIYLNRGQFEEFVFFQDEPKRIFSDKPILVAQFSQSRDVDPLFTGGNGDPFMIILSSTNQKKNDVTFVTYDSPEIPDNINYKGIEKYYVNIIALTSETQNIRFNDRSIQNEFVAFQGSNYSYVQKEIEFGVHHIENTNKNDGFLAYVYGFGGVESYGYGVGFNLDLVLDLGENIEFFKNDTLLLCGGDSLTLDAGPYFDNYLWSTGEKTNKIVVQQPGKYWVKTSTDQGCDLYDSVFVFPSNPKIDIGDRFDEGCFPYTMKINATGGFDKYIWQNRLNDTLSTDQSILADRTDEYRLTVFDKFRCSARDTFDLTVFPVPKVEILGEQLICGIDSTVLAVSITGAADSIWNFAGSFDWMAKDPGMMLSGATRTSVKVKALDWGDSEIYYRLRTIDGCETTDTFEIRFHPQPVSGFVFEDDSKCEGYSKKLVFTGSATDSAFFDWGLDGCQFVDTIDLQKRIFNISVGAFLQDQPQISLVIDDNGCVSNTFSETLSAKPNFVMDASPTRGCDSLTVDFSSRLLIPDIVDFVWTFDDTEVAKQQNVTKNYPGTGFHKVNLTITNPITLCTNGFTIDSMIKVFPTPIAEISTDPTFCYPDSALLVYTHHIDSSYSIWEFNGARYSGFGFDSITMVLENPFEDVKLTVNEYGCVSLPVEMRLKRKPRFDFNTESVDGCQPFSFEVFAETADKSLDFTWIADSLPYPTGTSNLVTLPDTGKFDMALIAFSNETGCADTLLKPGWIKVHRNPYAKFEVDYDVALIDNAEITFINYSERAANFFWDFGDNMTSAEFEPLHTYLELGDYNATLLAESEFGCTDTFGLGIKIIPATVYSPNAFRPDSDLPENRTFMPFTAGVDDTRFNLKIFNRWGEEVFESNSVFYPWDGSVKNGGAAPVGNYIWSAKYYDIQGKEHNEKGQVLLIR
jgi:PKD repeat protein